MTTKAALPHFLLEVLEDSDCLNRLTEVQPLAYKLGKNVQLISKLLSNNYQKTGEKTDSVIFLGTDIVQSAKEVGIGIVEHDAETGITLNQYLIMVDALVALALNLILANKDSLHNKALLKHLKQVINSILTETRTMDVVNTIFERLSGDEDDPSPQAG